MNTPNLLDFQFMEINVPQMLGMVVLYTILIST
jgi:hypothetical protein